MEFANPNFGDALDIAWREFGASLGLALLLFGSSLVARMANATKLKRTALVLHGLPTIAWGLQTVFALFSVVEPSNQPHTTEMFVASLLNRFLAIAIVALTVLTSEHVSRRISRSANTGNSQWLLKAVPVVVIRDLLLVVIVLLVFAGPN